MSDAVLALGSNLDSAAGDRLATLRSALAALRAVPEVRVVAVSPVYETSPVGGPEQPDFLNAVVLVDTSLSAPALLNATEAIEARHGRERSVRWGPRTLDVDLVDVHGVQCSGDRLVLPHPRAHERAFVLVPWLDADPHAELTGRGAVAGLAALLDRSGLRRVPGLVLLP